MSDKYVQYGRRLGDACRRITETHDFMNPDIDRICPLKPWEQAALDAHLAKTKARDEENLAAWAKQYNISTAPPTLGEAFRKLTEPRRSAD